MPSSNKEKQKEYDENRRGKRSRNFNVICYPEDLPKNWTQLLDDTHIRWVEGPLHDRDVFTAEDEQENSEHKAGMPKKKHKHNLLMFESLKTISGVKDFLGDVFGLSDAGSVIGVLTPQICGDRSGSIRYMAHLDNPTKAQYRFEDIIGHNGADPLDIVRFNATETLHKMIAIEEYIETNDIREMSDLTRQIRYTHLDWYQIVTVRNTVYFNAFVRSFRHKREKLDALQQALADGRAHVDEETGEIVFNKGENR